MGRKKKKKEEDEDDYASDVSGLQVIKRLYKYIGLGNKKYIIALFFFITGTVVFSWCTPLIFKTLVDEGLGGGIGSTTGNVDIIFQLSILFFTFTIASVLTRISQGYIIQRIATLTMYNLRHELFVKFQYLGMDYHDNPNRTAGKKISYLTNDVNTIQELIQSGLLMVVGNFFLIFGALAFMIFLSPQLTLVTFLIIPVIFSIGGVVFSKARGFFNELRERVSRVTSILDESIMGMRIIQAFAVEEETLKEFNKATELERQTTMKAAKLMAFVPGMIIFIVTIGLGVLFFTAGLLIRDGLITQGTLVAFIFYIFMFFEPLFSLLGFFTLLQNSFAAGARISKLLDEEPSIQDLPNALEINDVKGKIEYKNVNFRYKKDVPILKDINITIKEKERLALVGYTGAGKSTFIKLLSRFYDPPEGELLVDGLNLKNIKINSLRRKMGIVLQENFLFSTSVKENIRYGNLNATDEEIIETAKKVNAHDFIMELEDGYDTNVGERGDRLSEGQKQLIAFARALIADPPVLILDEATSAIDPYSELLIQQALETLLKGRTSISIAHRLSTIINSDRIVVLDKGQIIEEGSHQELIEKKDGFYKHLYEMQFKDPFKKEEIAEEEVIDSIDVKRESYDDKDKFGRML